MLDIESTGLDWTTSRVTCICARTKKGEVFSGAGPDEIELIENFIDWISNYSVKTHRIVTFNGKHFDISFIIGRLLLHPRAKESGTFLLNYDHFDIFEFIRKLTNKSMSLDTASKLLGCKSLKTGTGENALKLADEGRWEELIEYCAGDVKTTEELYLKLKKIHNV